LYSIFLIGGDAPLPERFGDHTEHRAAIELLAACLDGVHANRADLPRLNERRHRGRGLRRF
jgi:hypothetical protein